MARSEPHDESKTPFIRSDSFIKTHPPWLVCLPFGLKKQILSFFPGLETYFKRVYESVRNLKVVRKQAVTLTPLLCVCLSVCLPACLFLSLTCICPILISFLITLLMNAAHTEFTLVVGVSRDRAV